jgi:flagellar basal-body rod protein FlgC
MAEFDILRASAAGMDAERSALDLAARNVAAAQATPDRGSFERLIPKFAVAPAPGDDDDDDGIAPPDEPGAGLPLDDDADASLPVRYLGSTPERGVDVDAVTEMVAVLDAQRAYEANASVFDIGKRLSERTIDMGHMQ